MVSRDSLTEALYFLTVGVPIILFSLGVFVGWLIWG